MTKRHGLFCAMACGVVFGLAGMAKAQKPTTNAYLEFIRSAAQRDVAAGGAKL